VEDYEVAFEALQLSEETLENSKDPDDDEL